MLKLGAAGDWSQPLHLLAVWTKPEPAYVEALHTALLHYHDFLSVSPSIVAGDFNSNAIWDRPNAALSHSRLVKKFENDFGLVSAYHARTGTGRSATTWEPHPHRDASASADMSRAASH